MNVRLELVIVGVLSLAYGLAHLLRPRETLEFLFGRSRAGRYVERAERGTGPVGLGARVHLRGAAILGIAGGCVALGAAFLSG